MEIRLWLVKWMEKGPAICIFLKILGEQTLIRKILIIEIIPIS